MTRQQPPTEAEMLRLLNLGAVTFDPFTITVEPAADPVHEIDALVRLTWLEESLRFALKCRRTLSARTLEGTLTSLIGRAAALGVLPLVVSTYLDADMLHRLETAAASGIDLSGNGLVVAPGRWLVMKSGTANRFRTESVIKNVYRRNSSLVARLFLARPEFASVQEALAELTRLGGRVTLATVSKVCKVLADDLVIERNRRGATRLRLLQPDKLLELLAANFFPPVFRGFIRGRFDGQVTELPELLAKWEKQLGGLATLTGPSSVAAYAVMARDEAAAYYCHGTGSLRDFLGERFQRAERFANLTLIETDDQTVHFDRRAGLVASPVQTFLELQYGDKRDRQTADQLRRVVLAEVARAAAGS